MDYIYTEKERFIKKLTEALKVDERSGVEDITYYKPGFFEGHPNNEFIRIQYRLDAFAWINTTGNSNGANASEIVKEVYYNGATGRMCGAYWFEEAIKK